MSNKSPRSPRATLYVAPCEACPGPLHSAALEERCPSPPPAGFQLAQLTVAWQEEVRERTLLKQKLRQMEATVEEARQQATAKVQAAQQQMAVANLRMRAAEEAAVEANARWENAQVRVTELSSALVTAKANNQKLLDLNAKLVQEVERYRSQVARMTHLTVHSVTEGGEAQHVLTFYNDTFTPANSLQHDHDISNGELLKAEYRWQQKRRSSASDAISAIPAKEHVLQSLHGAHGMPSQPSLESGMSMDYQDAREQWTLGTQHSVDAPHVSALHSSSPDRELAGVGRSGLDRPKSSLGPGVQRYLSLSSQASAEGSLLATEGPQPFLHCITTSASASIVVDPEEAAKMIAECGPVVPGNTWRVSCTSPGMSDGLSYGGSFVNQASSSTWSSNSSSCSAGGAGGSPGAGVLHLPPLIAVDSATINIKHTMVDNLSGSVSPAPSSTCSSTGGNSPIQLPITISGTVRVTDSTQGSVCSAGGGSASASSSQAPPSTPHCTHEPTPLPSHSSQEYTGVGCGGSDTEFPPVHIQAALEGAAPRVSLELGTQEPPAPGSDCPGVDKPRTTPATTPEASKPAAAPQAAKPKGLFACFFPA